MRMKVWGWAADTAICISGLAMLAPFVWMIVTSLKPGTETMLLPPTWVSSRIEWSNYLKVWEMVPFVRYLGNSLIFVLGSAAGGIIVTILAAFAFSRLAFYGKNLLFAVMIGTMMVPEELLLVPNYITITRLGWIDRYEALIVPFMTNGFAVYLLQQHFLRIPAQYYYAARLDGSTPWTYLWRIMVPLAKPAIAAIMLMKAIGCWNLYLWPLIVTNSAEMRTLPVGLLAFSNEAGTRYELLTAASSLSILPVIVLYGLLHNQIFKGISHINGLKS